MTQMTPAEAIFFAAAALPDEDRAAYLAHACAGNDELRRQVERMLAARPEIDAFLEPPWAIPLEGATGTFAPDAPPADAESTADYPGRDEQAGAVIGGKYTLVEAIGEGGMGAVWRARQTEPVRRFVAVKLIKAGMDSRQVVARFEAERQALALMDHPNIAGVLDGGLHEGRPFFVMELVKGVPITEFCDARKLTPRQRLELFVPVCQAIQHAHQKGVIHRDIKPSNVLVALYDDRPVAKVIDFGVAKATGQPLTERTIDTGFGGVVGTPQYMSPEQATFNNLDVDTRSDVYALGVLLYELLTGAPPFARKELEEKGLLEMLRVVREEEPPRPSTKLSTAEALPTLSANRGTEPKKLTGLLKNELDWIVMKALEKDRARRYETANAFAADVQRYLAGEPVIAHPPSTGYRLRKFVRRNKGQVLAAAAVFAAVLVGAGAAVWQSMVARAAERDAVAAGAREAEQRAEAERKEAAARDAEAATKEVLKFVRTKVFAAAGPLGRAGGLGKDVKLLTALDAAEKSITENFANRPLVELEIREVLMRTYGHLGDYQARDRQLALWMDVCERKLNRIHPQYPGFLDSVVRAGDSNFDPASLPARVKRVEDAYQHYLNVLGPDDPGTLKLLLMRARMIAHQPDRRPEAVRLIEDMTARIRGEYPPDSRQALEFESTAARVRYLAQPSNDAIQQLEAVLHRMRGALPPEDPLILFTLYNLGVSYLNAKRYPEAIRHFEERFDLQVKQVGGEDQSLDSSLRGLANAYSSAGRDADVVKLLETYLPRLAEQLDTGHHEVLASAINLTHSLNKLKRYEDTIRVAGPYLRAGVEKYGSDHATIRLLKMNLLFAYLELERPEAETLLRDLCDTAIRDPKTGDQTIRALLTEQAEYHPGMKPGQKAVLLKTLLDVLEQKRAEPGWWRGRAQTLAQVRSITQHNLAVAYLDDGQVEPARPVVQAYLADLRSVYPENSAKLAQALLETVILYVRIKDPKTAEELLREAQAISERLQPGTVEDIATRYKLGQALFVLKGPEAAEKEIRAALEWYRSHEGPFANTTIVVTNQLLTLYREWNNGAASPERVEALLREIAELSKKQFGPESWQYATQLAILGLNMLELKQWAAAEAATRECLAIREKTRPDEWRTSNARSMLGGALLGQKKYAEAEPLLLKGYEGMKQCADTIPANSKVRLAQAADRLIEFYAATGKPEEARRWRAERSKYPPEAAPPPRAKK